MAASATDERTIDIRGGGGVSAGPAVTGLPAPRTEAVATGSRVPAVTRVEIDLGSGEVRRGALLGAVAVVQSHGSRGWAAVADADVTIRFTPLSGGPVKQTRTMSDCRGVARFAARHHESGTWSVHVHTPDGTPCSAARLVVVRD